MTDRERWEKIRQDLISEIVWWPTKSEALALGMPHMTEMLKQKHKTLEMLNEKLKETK